MGTKVAPPETGVGVIQRVGHTASIVREGTSETVYGRRGGSIYPIALIIVTATGTLVHFEVVALVALSLLAVWVGGKR